MMHTIQEIRAEYDRLDELLGVDTKGIQLVLSPRSVKRLGSFRSPAENVPPLFAKPLQISISVAAMEDDVLFWDTIRHEYAHAVVYLTHPGERHGHDEVWKAVCRRIECTPKSTTAASDEQRQEWVATAKYRVHCESCGADSYYHRAGKIVQLLMYGEQKHVRCRCGSHELSLYVRQ